MTALILTVAMTVPAPALTVADWQAAHERFPRWIPAPPAVEVGPVERWRPLVAEHFLPEHVDDALSVIACESEGNPEAANPRSTALGLWQFIRSTWDWVAAEEGLDDYNSGGPLDPEQATHAASWLSKGGTSWSHWVCRP